MLTFLEFNTLNTICSLFWLIWLYFWILFINFSAFSDCIYSQKSSKLAWSYPLEVLLFCWLLLALWLLRVTGCFLLRLLWREREREFSARFRITSSCCLVVGIIVGSLPPCSCWSIMSNSAQFWFWRSSVVMFRLSIWAISFCWMAKISCSSEIVSCSNIFSCFLFCLNSTWNSANIDRRLSVYSFCVWSSFFSFLFLDFISL